MHSVDPPVGCLCDTIYQNENMNLPFLTAFYLLTSVEQGNELI